MQARGFTAFQFGNAARAPLLGPTAFCLIARVHDSAGHDELLDAEGQGLQLVGLAPGQAGLLGLADLLPDHHEVRVGLPRLDVEHDEGLLSRLSLERATNIKRSPYLTGHFGFHTPIQRQDKRRRHFCP